MGLAPGITVRIAISPSQGRHPSGRTRIASAGSRAGTGSVDASVGTRVGGIVVGTGVGRPTVGVEEGSVRTGAVVEVDWGGGTVAVGNAVALLIAATRVGDATIV